MVRGVQVIGPSVPGSDGVLTDEALEFVADLHRAFDPRRLELLAARRDRQAELDGGKMPTFPPETADLRAAAWQVAPAPADLDDRRVEITGPAEAKMMINALNSGARVFMADLEDALSPTWANVVGGQAALRDAVRRELTFQSGEKAYALGDAIATLVVRPRGWHLPEIHVEVDREPIGASLLDAGLYLFHNADELLRRGSGPYLYLAKLESAAEAGLWNDVFLAAQARLGIPRGSIRATVLIETITAAFEMDEILWELREHAAGLNAGRWDYLFSCIKRFRGRPDLVLPDRAQLTMTVPFMRAYTELLVQTCHRRGAHAIGGMAAFIPSRRDPAVNETAMARVREDKERESSDGFDGTWVAHPDLVEIATKEFDGVLGERSNQVDRQREEVSVTAEDLLNVKATEGDITEAGLRNDVNVGIQYISSWLRGNGAAAINHLMEDAATAEIARSQVWQWVHHGVRLESGTQVTESLVKDIARDELDKVRQQVGDEFFYNEGRPDESRELFEQVALSEDFVEFLTLPAYERLD